jgi:hypothetical protein
MAAPDYVPVAPGDLPRGSEALPPDSWKPERPADLRAFQPHGPGFGNQGPDQGYGLKLARRFVDKLVLEPGEHHDDVIAGCLVVGLKRAALFGRAPVIHDFELAFALFGFLDKAPPDLVEWRRRVFAGAAHHYWQQLSISEVVPDEVVRLTPAEVRDKVSSDWRALLPDPPVTAPAIAT